MGAIIGIDLGTTYSAVAHFDDTGRPTIVRNSDGRNITHSCVALIEGELRVGEEAYKQWCGKMSGEAETAAVRFKRNMGTSKTYTIDDAEYSPTELSTLVLQQLAEDAKSLGPLGSTVITIPANFSNNARAATMAAAKAAGLHVQYIINEPTAAALYYAYKGLITDGIYAVYDLGGGTFDISIIEVVGKEVNVIISNGIARLGGMDFDQAILTLMQEKYENETGYRPEGRSYNPFHAERDKRSLSNRNKVNNWVPPISIDLSREEFEQAIQGYVGQTQMICETTIEEANMEPHKINGVILAGGSTRIPLVRHSIEQIFGKKPIDTVNVDEVVALGAALYAGYRSNRALLTSSQALALNNVKIQEVTNKNYGTIVVDFDELTGQKKPENSIIINKGTEIPCKKTNTYYTGVPNQKAVDCKITECEHAEADVAFVEIVKILELKLPPLDNGRPPGSPIDVTYRYDVNQMMHCEFKDPETGARAETTIDVSWANKSRDV